MEYTANNTVAPFGFGILFQLLVSPDLIVCDIIIEFRCAYNNDCLLHHQQQHCLPREFGVSDFCRGKNAWYLKLFCSQLVSAY